MTYISQSNLNTCLKDDAEVVATQCETQFEIDQNKEE